MKYKKYVIIIILCVLVIAAIIGIRLTNSKKEEKNEVQQEETVDEYVPQENVTIDQNQVAYQENTTVNELKEDVGATGDDSIYDVTTEYDGRQILTVKPDMQFCTVLAGILENKQPENDLKSLEQKGSSFLGKKGIWIASNSREAFQTLLKQTTKNTYHINEEGYLECESTSDANETDKKLEEILSSNNIYIITMTGTCYILDEISGQVVEYPFEQMDPYQACESYESGNQKIYVLTSNKAKKLSMQELIDAIVK